MPRPQRIEYEGAHYHVMNRGLRRQPIFHADHYRQVFLDTLAQAHQRFGAVFHAYCLMGNHYHLLVETPRGNLSRIMRHVNGVYTQAHNRLAGMDGPLFRGRFKAILVDHDNYLLRLSRYIHRNPIEAEPPLVKTLAAYRWSSYPAYVGRAPVPEWLRVAPTRAMLGSGPNHGDYQRYVEQGDDEELDAFYQRARTAPVLGTAEFVARSSRRPWQNITFEALQRQIHEPPDTAQIVEVVCRVFVVAPTAVYIGRRGHAEPGRWAAIYLCQEYGGQLQPEIAAQFGMRHVSGVSNQVRRARQAMEEDATFAECMKQVIHDLTPDAPMT